MTIRADRTITAGRTIAASQLLPKLGLFALWGTVVLVTLAHHEFWRDEVGALSLAIDSPHLWTVPLTIHGESHPALWYLLLRGAYGLAHASWVLPLVSVGVAAAAVLLFILRAPFSLWWKALFTLSVLPLYEYSVMARNYGISMLLMFAFAAVYTNQRYQPIRLGVLLFLLANTNVHSALLVIAYLGIWLGQRLSGPGTLRAGRARLAPRTVVGMVLAILGVLACIATIYPTYNDLIEHHPASGPLLGALKAIGAPGAQFGDLLLPVTGYPAAMVNSLILFTLALGLLIEPLLCVAALGATWAFALFFAEIYPGFLRHEGLLLVFIVTLYWIAARLRTPRSVALAQLAECAQRPAVASEPHAAPGWIARLRLPAFASNPHLAQWYGTALAVLLPVLFVPLIVRAAELIRRDVEFPVSESEAAARLIRTHPALATAIVLAEPDSVGMSLHYYLGNMQYLVRERRFGDSVRFTRSALLDLSLGELLATAERVHAGTGRRVVILLSHALRDSPREQFVRYGYGWTFRYTPAELAAFRAATEQVASLRDAPGSDENYDVYLLR